MHIPIATFEKPWGEIERLSLNQVSTIQFLTIKPGEELSLHYHELREDYWKIIKGTGKIILGESSSITEEGKIYFIPRTIPHSILNTGLEDLLIVEICFDNFDDTDTTRISDRYGRI